MSRNFKIALAKLFNIRFRKEIVQLDVFLLMASTLLSENIEMSSILIMLILRISELYASVIRKRRKETSEYVRCLS